MPGTVIVGTQWGDEGKGRFTDLLCDDMAMVVVRRVRQGMSALSRSACEFSPTGG